MDFWLPAVKTSERPTSLTATIEASYTNYRYWPELLSSGLLPAEMARRIVDARLSGGGQFCGMTRFADHLDDWPLADHLTCRSPGAQGRLLLISMGVAYHQG